MPDLDEWLARVESLRAVVEAHAQESERCCRLSPAVLEGIVERRLFRLWIPRSFDGEELDLPTSLRVFEAAGRIDGAFGWAVTIGVGGGLFAPLMTPVLAREIYAPAEALIAGSGAAAGVAVRERDGYRVRGRWQYASGVLDATWVTATCRVIGDDGAPSLLRAIAVPREVVRIHETWDTLGMRGTGSHDIEIDGFVPEAHVFDAFGVPACEGALYRVPFFSIAVLSFAALALGIAQHFLDLFALLAAGKPSPAGGVLERHPLVAAAQEDARAALAAVRGDLHATAERSWATILAGDPPAARQRDAMRAAAVCAARTAVESADRLFAYAGMSPLAMASPLGRAWRDLRTLSQHVLLSPLGRE